MYDDRSQVILGTGAALTLLLVTNKEGLVYPVQDEVSEKRPLGKDLAQFGNIMGLSVPNAIYAGSMWAHSRLTSSPTSLSRATYMFDATVFAGLTTGVLKYGFGERRPNKSDHLSFPSGHSSMAFSFAGVVLMEHGWGWGTPALALAGLVGLSRINDNYHYLHDVVFGATIGLVYAVSMQKFHTNKDVVLVPIFDDTGGTGIGLAYTY